LPHLLDLTVGETVLFDLFAAGVLWDGTVKWRCHGKQFEGKTAWPLRI